MPFPLAHGLLGATVITALDNQPPFKNWRIILIGAALAVIPDFDYLVNWLQVFGKGWHHGFSHSIILAIVFGFAGTLLTGKLSWGRFLVLSAAALSHGLLDFLSPNQTGSLCLRRLAMIGSS